MKRLVAATAMSVFLFTIILTVGSVRISAQQPTPPTGTLAATPTPDLERKVYQLEMAQTQTIESLRSSNQYNQFLITGVGGLIALLVAIQSFATVSQARRERERDLVDRTGVEQVSKIMSVVQQTLESRLVAEEEARKQLDKIRSEVQALDAFLKNFQATIENARQTIEKQASLLALTPRHDFRKRTSELDSFAQQIGKFETEFAPLEQQARPFSPRVPYIRGIAAHYANQPEIAKQYLTEVVGSHQPEAGETEIAYNRRVANAYCYLGLIESNFGNNQDAIASFENANRRDLQNRDFLTRVVTAEAYIMINDFEKAKQFITEVEDRLRAIEQAEGPLRNFHLHLRSRTALIRANMAILGQGGNWRDEARQLLEPVHEADPQYYYATATLAQVKAGQGDPGGAQKLFHEACETIERSGDLLIVTEARSKILLLMVAGMCCKHGFQDEKRSEEYLGKADGLRSDLPKIGPQVCTVFSTLSKRNENSETIASHIELIRRGDVLM